jgi:hypothetical protein
MRCGRLRTSAAFLAAGASVCFGMFLGLWKRERDERDKLYAVTLQRAREEAGVAPRASTDAELAEAQLKALTYSLKAGAAEAAATVQKATNNANALANANAAAAAKPPASRQ